MRKICLILTLLYSATLFAQSPNDSTWTDPTTGLYMHEQQLSVNDTLQVRAKRPFKSLTELFAINAAVLGYDALLFERSWAMISKSSIKENLTDGWVWDDDSFSGNEFSHPYHGSMFYNTARENGMNYGQSLLFPLIGSWSWEIFCENNRPAVNDLFATGVGGSAIGESTHRISDLLFDNSKRGVSRVFRELAGTLLNPVRGLQRIWSGEMFHVNPLYKGKREESHPYHFEIGLGDRWVAELGDPHPEYGTKYYHNIPIIDFTLNYGDHFDAIDGGKTHPFDQFDIYALMNLKSQEPTFGILDISGRIFSSQHTAKHNWSLDWGIYQNFRYLQNYWKDGNQRAGNLPEISEAASFGVGLYAEHKGKNRLSNLLLLSAVPMGCTNADYYGSKKISGIELLPDGSEFSGREYNYGPGFSIRENTSIHLGRYFTLGNRFYLIQIHTFTGYNPKHLETHHNAVMGDKGYNTAIMNTTYSHINLNKKIRFRVEFMYFFRNGVYDYYDNMKVHSCELKTTLSYSI